MSANNELAPIDITHGSFSVSQSGSARYHYPIAVPPGRGAKENTPQLALSYDHTNSNGILGVGWAMSGFSTISRLPLLPGLNLKPTDSTYPPHGRMLALDGNYMILQSGTYAQPDAKYLLELDTNKQINTVSSLGTVMGISAIGFRVTDATGRQTEYGTTADSLQLSADGKSIVEWKICRSRDIHGNCILYSYTTQPTSSQASGSATIGGVIYPDTVSYTSNDLVKPALSASSFVKFQYASRNDPIISAGTGGLLQMSHIMKSVTVSVIANQVQLGVRTYSLDYQYSGSGGAAQLVNIRHRGSSGSELPPTMIEYASSPGASSWFTPASQKVDFLLQDFIAETLVPVNITGTGLSDVVLIGQQRGNDFLSIAPITATIKEIDESGNASVRWNQPTSDSLCDLPNASQFPQVKFIPGDFSGNGTSDIVMAYNGPRQGDGMALSLSSCTGTGYIQLPIVQTNLVLDATDEFFAFDCTGNGRADLVQVASVGSRTKIRTWLNSASNNGPFTLTRADDVTLDFDSSQTVQWFDADLTRNGSRDLVRIWYEDSLESRTYNATSYLASRRAGSQVPVFQEHKKSTIGSFRPTDQGYSDIYIVPIDFNLDGLIDLVACRLSSTVGTSTILKSDMWLALSDGEGNFVQYGKQKTNQKLFPGRRVSFGEVPLETLQLTASGAPSIALRCKDDGGNQMLLLVRSNTAAQLGDFEEQQVLSGTDYKSLDTGTTLTSADITGAGKSGWLAWSVTTNETATVLPIYNNSPITDVMTLITNPMGLRVNPTYRPLTIPSVYKPLPLSSSSSSAAYNVQGASRYVVAQYGCSNNETRNALSVNHTIRKVYEGARVNPSGRGWQGFSKIWTQCVSETAALTIDHFAQDWPLSFTRTQEDTYKQQIGNFLHDQLATPQLNQSDLMKSMVLSWGFTSQLVNGANVHKIQIKTREESMFDEGTFQNGLATLFTYNNNGFKETEIIRAKPSFVSNEGAFQKGTFTKYQTSTTVLNVPYIVKSTTVESNLNALKDFKEGDIDLAVYVYDTSKNNITQKNIWFDANKLFVEHTYQYDDFGNRTQSVNPSGLTTKSTYDPVSHQYVIRSEESGPSMTTTLTRNYAYDIRFGARTAEMAYNGSVEYSYLDEFGRVITTFVTALPEEKSASAITPVPSYVVMSDTFKTKMSQQLQVQSAQINYSRISNQGNSWIFKTEQSPCKAGDSSNVSIQTIYYDGCSLVRQSMSKEGTFKASWIYKNYDHLSRRILESVLLTQQDISNPVAIIKSEPDQQQCRLTVYDVLGRISQETMPVPSAGKQRLFVKVSRGRGGLNESMYSYPADSNGTPGNNNTIQKVTNLQYAIIAGTRKLQTSSNEQGWTTTYQYNPAGHLMETTYQGGPPDKTYHDLQGTLLHTDNVYQNPNGNKNGALSYQYYNSGHLKTETNAMNETTSYEYDAKLRILTRTGFDGRKITYQYDGTPFGLGKISTATVLDPASQEESSASYLYNQRGHASTVTRSIFYKNAAGTPTSYKVPLLMDYNLMGQVETQHFGSDPDSDGGLNWNIGFEGRWMSHSSCSVSAQKKTLWEAVNTAASYSPHNNCTQWNLSSNSTLGSTTTTFTAEYDDLNACRTRKFEVNNKTFVDEKYDYYEIGLRKTKTDLLNNAELSYQYMGSRLWQVQGSGQDKTFNYSPLGDLQSKNGMAFQYTTNGATGTVNGQKTLDVVYDGCGRMISRTHNGRTLSYKYNGFNHISEQTDTSTNQTTFYYDDHNGKRLFTRQSDGSVRFTVTPCYSLSIDPKGQQVIKYYLQGPGGISALISYPASQPQSAKIKPIYADWKGTVSHIFTDSGQVDGVLEYDEFGQLLAGTNASTPNQDDDMTYEARSTLMNNDLLDFGARQYDPVLGRFTVPDTQWSHNPAVAPDALNRYCFENNNPVNAMDPSGHMTWEAGLGLGLGIALVIAAIALTVMTGGVASPLLALAISAGTGFLMGAGMAGISYSISHANQGGTGFLVGYLESAAIGGAIGAILGPAGKFLSVMNFGGAAAVSLTTAATEAASTAGIEGAETTAESLIASEAVEGSAESLIGSEAVESSAEGEVATPEMFAPEGNGPPRVSMGMKVLINGIKVVGGSGGGVLQQLTNNKINGKPLTTDLGWAAGSGGFFGATGALVGGGLPGFANSFLKGSVNLGHSLVFG